MVKLADTQDLGSCAVTGVQVQVLFWANKKLLPFEGVFFCPERKPTVGLSSGVEVRNSVTNRRACPEVPVLGKQKTPSFRRSFFLSRKKAHSWAFVRT